MVDDLDETLTLIRQEINDAKVKGFNKLLYFLLSDYPSDMVLDRLEGKVLEVYKGYKDDINKVLRMYVNTHQFKNVDKKTMFDFIKDLEDLEDQ